MPVVKRFLGPKTELLEGEAADNLPVAIKEMPMRTAPLLTLSDEDRLALGHWLRQPGIPARLARWAQTSYWLPVEK